MNQSPIKHTDITSELVFTQCDDLSGLTVIVMCELTINITCTITLRCAEPRTNFTARSCGVRYRTDF